MSKTMSIRRYVGFLCWTVFANFIFATRQTAAQSENPKELKLAFFPDEPRFSGCYVLRPEKINDAPVYAMDTKQEGKYQFNYVYLHDKERQLWIVQPAKPDSNIGQPHFQGIGANPWTAKWEHEGLVVTEVVSTPVASTSGPTSPVPDFAAIDPLTLISFEKFVESKPMGYFKKIGGSKIWREESSIDAGGRDWTEINVDEHSLFLQSETDSIQIDLYMGTIYHSTNGFQSKDALYSIRNPVLLTSPSTEPSANPVIAVSAGTERVEFKTADKPGAGTDSDIDLELWGVLNGVEKYSGKIRVNPLISGNAFEQNSTDSCLIPIPGQLGSITKIQLTSNGQYPGSSWDIEWIKIQGRQFNINANIEKGSLKRDFSADAYTPPRPVYVIAHEVNGSNEIAGVIANGANAIEADFLWTGSTWVVQHPKDIAHSNPVQSDLTKWLSALKAVADQQGNEFAFVYFDIKNHLLKDSKANFATKINELYTQATAILPDDLNLLFSTSEYSDREAFVQIVPKLTSHHGVAIDCHNNPNEVAAYFSGLGVENVWYANGITSLLPERFAGPKVRPSLATAVALRDKAGQIKKVCSWTYVRRDSIREQFFSRSLDATIVEKSAVVMTVQMVNGGLTRLAKRNDQAFVVHR
jgi:PLAT/LH2 domain